MIPSSRSRTRKPGLTRIAVFLAAGLLAGLPMLAAGGGPALAAGGQLSNAPALLPDASGANLARVPENHRAVWDEHMLMIVRIDGV